MEHREYIRDVENKNTVVLFIHGFLGSPNHFNDFIEVVPHECAVYNILLKGHGGTVLDFANASMKEWKSQVNAILDKLAKEYKEIIIVGHSMGTLFAAEAADKYKDKVKSIFLMQIPLKIAVKGEAFVNTLKSFFNLTSENDAKGKAYKNAHSVKLNKRVWEYIGWIPRYLELFSEAKKGRENILKVDVPSYVFQSEKDELVSMKSLLYIPDKENIKKCILKNSAHFIYDDEDYSVMKNRFKELFFDTSKNN